MKKKITTYEAVKNLGDAMEACFIEACKALWIDKMTHALNKFLNKVKEKSRWRRFV